MLKAASASAMLNAILMAMQIVIGLAAHSDGLLADGIHTSSDLAADGVVLFVLYVGARRASRRRPAASDVDMQEAIAALLIAVLLFVTAGEMLWQSVSQPAALRGGLALQAGALAVTAFVTLAKGMLSRYLSAAARRTGSAMLRASAWHARLDAISALVATLGIAGSMAGLPMLDHFAGAAIGLMIMRMGWVSAANALKQGCAAPLWKGAARGQAAD
ncbi:MAG TPA: cation diffusion facilitator family transporter [Paraburkholderia sp.]|nr:cation diffusion facilitator family transporter [Paraburkholderia sp.]